MERHKRVGEESDLADLYNVLIELYLYHFDLVFLPDLVLGVALELDKTGEAQSYSRVSGGHYFWGTFA